MFTTLLASGAEIVNGTYPGGASASDPVPESVAYYGTDITYGILMFLVLSLMLFAVTRLNVDR